MTNVRRLFLLVGSILPVSLHAARNTDSPIHYRDFEKGHQVRYWCSGGHSPVRIPYCGSLEAALREGRLAVSVARRVGMTCFHSLGQFYYGNMPEDWRDDLDQVLPYYRPGPEGERWLLDTPHAYGLEMIIGVNYGIPAWALDKGCTYGAPPPTKLTEDFLAGYGDYWYRIVRRYGDRVKLWEL